jgi:hypothetical protein
MLKIILIKKTIPNQSGISRRLNRTDARTQEPHIRKLIEKIRTTRKNKKEGKKKKKGNKKNK